MKNKRIISLILFIVIGLLVAPYFVGNLAKQTIENQATQISQLPGYNLNIQSYDQGWFTSQAKVSYGFDDHTLNIFAKSVDQEDGLDQSTYDLLKKGLQFDITVAHGPVTLQDGIQFALLTLYGDIQKPDAGSALKLTLQDGADAIFNFSATVSYGGNTNITAQSPSLQLSSHHSEKDSFTVNFSGLNLTGTINAAVDQYETEMEIGILSFAAPDGNFSFGPTQLQSTGNKLNDILWLGEGSFTVAEMSLVESVSNNSFMLNNFSSTYDLRPEGDNALTMKMATKIDTIDVTEISLSDVLLNLDINHLDRDAMTDYVKSLKEVYQGTNEAESDEQMATEIKVIASRVGEKFLKGSPEIVVNQLDFTMLDGFWKSNGKLTFDGSGLNTIEQLSDPIALNKRLSALADIMFNKALAKVMAEIGLKRQLAAGGVDLFQMPKEQLDQMITVQSSAALQSFVTQGYLSQEGDTYATHFEMKDGQRLINGKPLPIPGMQ